MWYSFRESNKQYPLSIERVKEILELNKKGVKPEELQPVELEASGSKSAIKVDAGFVNDVGQISLRSLEKGSKKKSKSRSKGKGGQGGGDNRNQQGGQPKQARDNNQPRRDGNKGGSNRPQRPQQGEREQQQPKQAQQGNKPQGGGENRNQQGNRQGGNRNRGKGGGGNRPQRPPQGEAPQQG